jgi:DNA-binding transcriptional regulator YiaG
MTTGADVRAWRQRLGLTQAQAAEALGVSDRAIRAWERGDYEPGKPVARLMEAIEREATKGD